MRAGFVVFESNKGLRDLQGYFKEIIDPRSISVSPVGNRPMLSINLSARSSRTAHHEIENPIPGHLFHFDGYVPHRFRAFKRSLGKPCQKALSFT
jgi:hypothetical protein